MYKSFQLHMHVAGNTPTPSAPDLLITDISAKTIIGETTPIATLAAGAATQMSLTWNTTNVQGDWMITAIADPRNTISEAREDNNEARRTVTLQGNKVQNGSFEQSANGSSPDAWSGSAGTQYDTTGKRSSDGSRAVAMHGDGQAVSLRNPAWTSTPIAVVPGETYIVGSTISTQNVSSALVFKLPFSIVRAL